MTNFRMTKEVRTPNVEALTGASDLDFRFCHSLVISHWAFVIGVLLLFGCGTDCEAALRYTADEHWDADRGLPEDTVLAIAQTRDGYLWLGTLDGLVRFDGVGRSTGAGRINFP